MNGLTLVATLRGLAIGGLLVAWAALAHYASAGGGASDFTAAVACAPLVAIALILLWRVSNPLWLVIGGACLMALLAAIWPALRQNVALIYLVQHVGTNLALGALFGRTLLPGRQALVTKFALLAHDGQISAIKERYTRGVTLAWALFFLGMAIISILLFFFATPAVWSVFANLLSYFLIALMFVVEHLARRHLLPPDDQSSVADTIRGYRLSTRRHSESP